MEISHSPWPWLRSDATALAGYANMMMMIPCKALYKCSALPTCTGVVNSGSGSVPAGLLTYVLTAILVLLLLGAVFLLCFLLSVQRSPDELRY